VVITRADMKTDTLDNSFGRALPGPSGVVDVAWGAGFQIGAVWDLNDQLTFAVDYQSRVWMQRFEKYTHAFPSTVDRPPVFQVGVDFKKVLPNTIIALDYKFINEEAVETMELQPASDPGGFGWKNIHVIALGLQHQFNSALTLRAGWSYGNSPIDDEHVFANVLFPAIVEHHFNAGSSMKFSNSIEFGASAYITPMTKRTDSGTGDSFSSNNAGTVLKHQQFGAQLSVKYSF
jgi:long-chain fatty acid transport protein